MSKWQFLTPQMIVYKQQKMTLGNAEFILQSEQPSTFCGWAEHPHTSDSDKAAATFAEQFSEQVLTPTPSLLVTPSHGVSVPQPDSRMSDAGMVLDRHRYKHMHTRYSFGNPQRRWEKRYSESPTVIIQIWVVKSMNSVTIPWFEDRKKEYSPPLSRLLVWPDSGVRLWERSNVSEGVTERKGWGRG